MATGVLYTYSENFRAYKILIAAQYSGASVRVASEPPSFQFGETNKSSDFLRKFPLGKVPAFEASNGDCIFESNAIAHYVGNAQLRGANERDASFVRQWIDFAENEILPSSCTWVFPCLGIIQYNKQDSEKAKEQIKKVLTVLDSYLLSRTYLVGERISQADISVACNLLLLYKYVLSPDFRKPFVNVNRWFVTLMNQPQFRSVIGNVSLCTTMAQFDAKKYTELHGKKGKQSKQEKPKQEKKKVEKEKKEEDEEEEEEEEKPKPSKDPFVNYPKGTFVMDQFKKCYSNENIPNVAIPHFWEHFDKENYSIWFSEYKYNDELTHIFMTCNLVSGLFQRLDKLNKNAFASVLVFGEDNKNSISGVWVWRGHDLVFKLSEDWQTDYEVYDWKKLDPDSEETKKLVKEYFSWEGDFDGKIVNQGKIFK